MSPTRRDFIKTTAATAAAIVAGPGGRSRVGADDRRPGRRSAGTRTRKRGAQRGALGRRVVRRRPRRTLPPPDDRHARAPGQRRQRQRVVRPRRSHAGQRLLGICRDEHDEPRGRAGRRRSRPLRCRKAARAVQKRRVELAPVAPVVGTWMTPVRRDPLEVPIEDKIALLLAANEAALKVKNVRFVNSGLQLLREVKTLRDVGGHQRHADVHPRRPVVHRRPPIGDGDFQSYEEELAPRGQGWEYVESLDMPGNAERWASLAAEKLTAQSVEAGHVRSDSRSDQSLAHDPRVDRPSHRARSRDRLRGQLRRHELRRAAREDARQAQVRPGRS